MQMSKCGEGYHQSTPNKGMWFSAGLNLLYIKEFDPHTQKNYEIDTISSLQKEKNWNLVP